MDAFLKFLKIAGVILGIVVIGVVIGLLATGGNEVTVALPKPAPTNAASSAVSAEAGAVPGAKEAAIAPLAANPLSTGSVAAGTPSNLITNWSETLDDILGSDKPDPEKAKELLALFPRVSEEGHVELAQHLSNLVADEDYAPLGQFLTNAAFSEEVLDLLLSDLLNRPNPIKLPLLVDVARNPKHPKAEEAKDLLELYLEEDYGNDWATWRTKVEQWLKDNPD